MGRNNFIEFKKVVIFGVPGAFTPTCHSSHVPSFIRTVKDFNEITKKYDAIRRCLNEEFKCEKIAIESLKHFVSKEALNIDGFGKKIVQNFWDLNMIKYPADIFNLNFDL